MSKNLKECLRSDAISTENIFKHKFLYDVSLAAARRGYSLGIYRSEMDVEGFDVILNDKDVMKPLQLKTVIGKTGGWSIHKSILRPSAVIAERHEGGATHTTVGIEGGIVLQKISIEKSDAQVEYFYTDYFILNLLYKRIILRNVRTYAAISRVLNEMREGKGSSKITIPKGIFVKAKSADSLLTLCGLHSNVGNKVWAYHLKLLEEGEKQIPKTVLENSLIDDVKILVCDKVRKKHLN